MSDFESFTGTPGQADLDLLTRYDDVMRKYAILGDPKRETEFLVFFGAGYREIDVRFFPTKDRARALEWLQSSKPAT